MLPCCLVPDLLPYIGLTLCLPLDSVCSCLDHCLCTWITPLVKPSGYCSPIEDHARLLEYSSALPSIYLFAICSTLPVFLTMSIKKSLHMDPYASRLVRSVTEYSATRGSSRFLKNPGQVWTHSISYLTCVKEVYPLRSMPLNFVCYLTRYLLMRLY